ncbi:hypothetical protein PTMSG1_05809 [Pyrenophora teres f. maculata]|nr:hypothetical protein PTMSG1_05809 [Pyrenophora teres f. maculata]
MAFKQLQMFTPDAAAPFIPELLRYMDSLGMSSLNRGKTKVDAIHASLIQHLLPEGVPVDQEDEEEGIILSDAQTLRLYRRICQKTKSIKGETIDDCLRELKASPYINTIDFVDSCRTGKEFTTFTNWHHFCGYTMSPGKTISLGYAKTSGILAPLLQNLQNSPNSVDPLASRQGLLRDLHHRLSAREIHLQQRFNVTIGPERSDPRILQPIAPLTSDRRQDASITNRMANATSLKMKCNVIPTSKPASSVQTPHLSNHASSSTSANARVSHPAPTSTRVTKDTTRRRDQRVQIKQESTATTNKRAHTTTTTEEPPKPKRKRRTELEMLAL